MVMCWALGCKHYSPRETCRFFKFPKNVRERNKWKMLVRRMGEPGSGASLCSCHFLDGKRENGPQFFEHNKHKLFQFPSPERRKRRSRRIDKVDVKEEVTEANGTTEVHMSPKRLKFDEPSTSSQTIYLEPQPSTSLQEPQPSTSLQDPHPYTEPQSVTSAQQVPPSFVIPQSLAVLEAENYFLRKELKEKEEKLQYLSNRMSFESIKDNDELILFYTGLPNASTFNTVFHLIKDLKINYHLKWKVEKINRQEQLLLTLMNLRQNFLHIDLAYRFGISQAAVSNIVITFVHILHKVLFLNLPTPVDVLPAEVGLDTPPFLTTVQFSPEQDRQTACIAGTQTHVKRAIRRIKMFKILNSIPDKLTPYAKEVFQTVAALTNYSTH